MRRALALAIRGYRRWISGRGPLRRVGCTFAGTESCSAYGLRVTSEVATSLPAALRLIRARLRACRDSSLHRFGARGLGWGTDHDRAPDALIATLRARAELPASIALVLTARELVARYAGDGPAAHACGVALHAAAVPRRIVPLRPGDAGIARHRRLGTRALVLALALLLLVVPPLLLLRTARAHRRTARRLARQRAAGSFLRPVLPCVVERNDAATRNAA